MLFINPDNILHVNYLFGYKVLENAYFSFYLDLKDRFYGYAKIKNIK